MQPSHNSKATIPEDGMVGSNMVGVSGGATSSGGYKDDDDRSALSVGKTNLSRERNYQHTSRQHPGAYAVRGISASEDSASSEDDNDSGGQGSQDVATSSSIDEANNNDGPTDMPLLSATRVDDSERSTTDQIYDDPGTSICVQ